MITGAPDYPGYGIQDGWDEKLPCRRRFGALRSSLPKATYHEYVYPRFPSSEGSAIIATSSNGLRTHFIFLLAALAIVLLASCESAASAQTVASGASQTDRLSALVVAADLAVGINRFPFVLIGSDGQAMIAASVEATFAN